MADQHVLELPREPASARTARVWVTDRLRTLGREDLVETAALGVSELVTNAILHTDSGVTVQLRGTTDHPRIEVLDRSRLPPRVNAEMDEEEFLLSTVGRGLALVALHAATWGSEIAADGKLVWFEPASEARSDGDLSGDIYDWGEVVEDLLTASHDPGDRLTVRLLDMPVQVFVHHRTHYHELLRELRLLALADPAARPLAQELADLSVQVERDRRRSDGVDRLAEAAAAGLDRADLAYVIPSDAPARMARLLELLEDADELAASRRLLAVTPGPQAVALRRWYLGEFVRQAHELEPLPWPGGFTVED